MNGRAVAGKQLRNNIKCYLQGNDGLPGSRGTKGDSGEKVRNKKISILIKKSFFCIVRRWSVQPIRWIILIAPLFLIREWLVRLVFQECQEATVMR